MHRRISAILFLIAILTTSGLNGCSGGSSTPEAVIVIVVDTLRPDRLSCYGYKKHGTPNIDSIAERGVRFARAHSVASWTVPSMGALMTSRYPAQLGLVEKQDPGVNGYRPKQRRDQVAYGPGEDELTMAEILSTQGFKCAAFVNQPGLMVGNGFMQGFDMWYYPKSASEIASHDPSVPMRRVSWKEAMLYSSKMDSGLSREMSKWMAANKGEKLFAWIHMLTPHQPYTPTPEYLPANVNKEDPSQYYDAEIRMVDNMIGELLKSIDRNLGLDNTLIVFVSDHGEELGEHGEFEHGHSMHKEIVQIPLMMAGPGLPAGVVMRDHVRIIDVLPTILDLNTIAMSASFEGVSLLPMLNGEDLILPVYMEGMLYGPSERALIAGNNKVIYDTQADTYKLYDLAKDRREKRDIAGNDAERTTIMQTALTQWHEVVRASGAGNVADSAEQERALEALKSLGYINK